METAKIELKNHLVLADEPFVEPKAGSAAWMMAPRIPQLLRKAGRAAVVYGLSYLAVKALDRAAENNPKNGFLAGADQVANVVFVFENLLVGGAVMMAKAGYDAVTEPHVIPEPQKRTEAAKVKPHVPVKHKHHRNRANLNATLMPDGLPVAGSGKTPTDIAPMPLPSPPKHQDFTP